MPDPGRKLLLVADPKTKTSVAPSRTSKDAAAASTLASMKTVAIRYRGAHAYSEPQFDYGANGTFVPVLAIVGYRRGPGLQEPTGPPIPRNVAPKRRAVALETCESPGRRNPVTPALDISALCLLPVPAIPRIPAISAVNVESREPISRALDSGSVKIHRFQKKFDETNPIFLALLGTTGRRTLRNMAPTRQAAAPETCDIEDGSYAAQTLLLETEVT